MAAVAPAAVAALVGAMVLASDGRIEPLPAAQLAAVAAGFVAVRRTGNVMLAVAVGLPVMWALELVL